MLFESVWPVVGLGYFLLLTIWRYIDIKSFWGSCAIKFNLSLTLLYLAGGAAAAFGGGYLYNSEGDACRLITNSVANMAVADAVAGVFIRLPYMMIILFLLYTESREPGALEKSHKEIETSTEIVFVMCAAKNAARLFVVGTLFVVGFIPLLIANGVIVTQADALVSSVGSPCLYLYRYCQFETVYPIVGLGFFIFGALCRGVAKTHFDDYFRAIMVTFIIFVGAGSIVLLYAIKLVVDDSANCRDLSDAVPNMALIDVIANGVFRLPLFFITFFALLTYHGRNKSPESIALK
jgi:hypothetical protein